MGLLVDMIFSLVVIIWITYNRYIGAISGYEFTIAMMLAYFGIRFLTCRHELSEFFKEFEIESIEPIEETNE